MSKYNSDELVPPNYVDEALVIEVLKAAEKDPDIKLIKHEIQPGSAAGDHYASIMFKIIASYESKGKTVQDRRFILKTMPQSGEKSDILKEIPLFDNEIRIYSETFPAMEEILNKTGETPFWPRMVYATQEPPVIVFDDVTQIGFKMNYQPLSFDKLKQIVEKLAKYHALSMALADSDKKDLVCNYRTVIKTEIFRPMFEPTMKQTLHLIEEIKTWPGLEKIGDKLEPSLEKLFDHYMEAYTKPDKLNHTKVLNHGDFHIRNLMFSEDDVLFLDFQIPSYRAASFDLVYMLNAIGGKEVRDRKMEVIKLYHRYLVAFLEKFGFKGQVPSIIDLHTEVLNMAQFEAFQLLMFLPISRVDLTGVELGDMFGKDKVHPLTKALAKVYKEQEFIDDLSRSLIYFDDLGIFD